MFALAGAFASGCSSGRSQVATCPALTLPTEENVVAVAIDRARYGALVWDDQSFLDTGSTGVLRQGNLSFKFGAGPSDRQEIYGSPDDLSGKPEAYILAHSTKRYEYRSTGAEHSVMAHINTALVLLRYELDTQSHWFVCIVSRFSRPDRTGEWRVKYRVFAQESAEWWSGKLDDAELARFLENQRAIESLLLPAYAGAKDRLLSYEVCHREIEALFGAVPKSLLMDSDSAE